MIAGCRFTRTRDCCCCRNWPQPTPLRPPLENLSAHADGDDWQDRPCVRRLEPLRSSTRARCPFGARPCRPCWRSRAISRDPSMRIPCLLWPPRPPCTRSSPVEPEECNASATANYGRDWGKTQLSGREQTEVTRAPCSPYSLANDAARSRRASVRSFPNSSRTSNSPGLALRPVVATRVA